MHSLRAFSPLLLLGLAAVAAEAQPATRVADLNTTVPKAPFLNQYQDFEALGNVLYFANDDGIHGSELWRTDGTAAGTRLVKDICPGSCPGEPAALTVSNGFLFFTANDGAHGQELWKTDGTAAGTVLVADTNPRLEKRISTVALMDVDGTLFFLAEDGTHGEELWATDGTAAGTRLVKDVRPGPHGSSGRLLAASGNLLLFTAIDDTHGFEPWVSDGTEQGTVMLGDLNPDNFSSIQHFLQPVLRPDAIAAPWGGFLFSANDGENGRELWATDGTPAGTARLKDISEGFLGSAPYGMTVLNGTVYFAAQDALGIELWKTDGTEAGTVLVKDIQPGSAWSNPLEITVAGNRLFFRASDGTHGFELWTSDGTAAGTTLVADLNAGAGDSFPIGISGGFLGYYGLSPLGSDLVFLAQGPGGIRLWRTNGTAAGTVALSPPVFSEATLRAEDSALVAGGRFYCRSGASGFEIWTSEGTAAGTVRLRDFVTQTSSFFLLDGKPFYQRMLGPLGNLLLFQGNDGTGAEPWKTDGAPGGTSQVAELGLAPSGSSPQQIQALGSQALFLANTNGSTRLWSSDGTPGGTQALTPPGLGTGGNLPVFGDSAFFTAYTNLFDGEALWKTDGTPAGTVQVADLSGSNLTGPILVSGGKLFFVTFRSDRLWTSDGTAAGTTSIDLYGIVGSFPIHLTAAAGVVFFYVPGFFQNELWRSDGTEAGTVQVGDIQAGSYDGNGNADHGEIAGTPGALYFSGDDGQTGLELWKSDGTEAGTVRIADVFPGPHGSNPRWITPVENRIYFVADDGVHGRELWVSDGTEAGTRMVADIVPGPGSSVPDNLAAVGPTLLFSAFTPGHGVELWRTGGTLLGTRRVHDIAPGALSSSPTGITAAGPSVYFAANDNATGVELWTVPKASVLATFGDVPTNHWASPYVETLAANGLTLGCSTGLYCPDRSVTRAEVAVFILRIAHGNTYVPPDVAATRFEDVPTGHWAVDWIEQLAVEDITSGCNVTPPLFCPESATARDQMAVFLLRALHGSDYTPPPATGTVFDDVPAGYWAAAWIEQLAAEGITGGCEENLYCPGAPVSRAQMAVFLTRALNLPLP